MEIIVGTNNQGKLKEMQSGLKDPLFNLSLIESIQPVKNNLQKLALRMLKMLI